MLNCLSWLQRRWANSPQARASFVYFPHTPKRNRHSQYRHLSKHSGFQTRERATIRDGALGLQQNGDIRRRSISLRNSSVSALNSTTAVDSSLSSFPVKNVVPTKPQSPRSGSATSAENITKSSLAIRKGGLRARSLRRTKPHHDNGFPANQTYHILRMILYRNRKKHRGMNNAESYKIHIQKVRDILATSLRVRAFRTALTAPKDEEDNTEVHIRHWWRQSPLTANGRLYKKERYFPYWYVASRRIFARYERSHRYPYSFPKVKHSVGEPGTRSFEGLNLWWSQFSPRRKRRFWMSALLLTLHRNPKVARVILEDIFKNDKLRLPVHIVSDCVHHIVSYMLRPAPYRSLKDIPYATQAASVAFFKRYLIWCQQRLGTVYVDPVILGLLIRNMEMPWLLNLLSTLKELDHQLHYTSIQNLAYRFVQEEKIKEAMEHISSLPREALEYDSTLQLCVYMLRYPFEKPKHLYKVRTSILTSMLQLGIRPNLQMHGVILLNAMEAGDRKTAWSSYRIMQENGVPPNAYTYSVLLHGSKHGDDLASVSTIYRQSLQENILPKSPALAAHLIHAVHHLGVKQRRPHTFQQMLRLYSQLFDLRPLQDIGIGLDALQTNSPGTELMRPSSSVLGSMLTAWLEENLHSQELFVVYEKFICALKDRSSRIAILGHSRYAFHAFMMAFSRRGYSLEYCTAIIQIMRNPRHYLYANEDQFPSPESYIQTKMPSHMAKSKYRRDLKISPHPVNQIPGSMWYMEIPQPDTMTWNILINAFIRNNDHETAENILHHMIKNGQTPDNPTWSTLIDGYAYLQLPDGLVDTVRRKAAAGFDVDDRTLRALRRLRNRKALVEAFSKAEAESDALEKQGKPAL